MPSPSNEEQITEHRAWLAGISEEGLALFSDLGNLLSEVDELLLKSDEVLNYSQPQWTAGHPLQEASSA